MIPSNHLCLSSCYQLIADLLSGVLKNLVVSYHSSLVTRHLSLSLQPRTPVDDDSDG
jgi:hypothetical protein